MAIPHITANIASRVAKLSTKDSENHIKIQQSVQKLKVSANSLGREAENRSKLEACIREHKN